MHILKHNKLIYTDEISVTIVYIIYLWYEKVKFASNLQFSYIQMKYLLQLCTSSTWGTRKWNLQVIYNFLIYRWNICYNCVHLLVLQEGKFHVIKICLLINHTKKRNLRKQLIIIMQFGLFNVQHIWNKQSILLTVQYFSVTCKSSVNVVKCKRGKIFLLFFCLFFQHDITILCKCFLLICAIWPSCVYFVCDVFSSWWGESCAFLTIYLLPLRLEVFNTSLVIVQCCAPVCNV